MTAMTDKKVETPSVESEQWELEHANGDKEMVVSADFASTLERELSAKCAELERVKGGLKSATPKENA